MKQGLIPETKDETSPIKALASNVLQRIQRNKHETTGHLSVSVPSQSTFPENSKNRPTKLTDSTDKCEKEGGLSVMSVSSLQEEREERLAIVEHEGQQSPLQAHKIAYQDAFIGILVSLHEQHSSLIFLSMNG